MRFLEVPDYSCDWDAEIRINSLFGILNSDFKSRDSPGKSIFQRSIEEGRRAFAHFEIYVDMCLVLVLHLIPDYINGWNDIITRAETPDASVFMRNTGVFFCPYSYHS